MKTSPTAPVFARAFATRPVFTRRFTALLAALLAVSCPLASSRAQPAAPDQEGAEVLTRGPVHEAFAGMVSYNPEPGIVVSAPPPELIEELPPEEKPEGDDVAWIPGYWGWDDERSDYLWISGTWRALPPGREWIAGYWRDTGQGHQWISGYWADASARETTYLPPPPATLEVGANIAAPSIDYGWTPGCWVWYRERYAWRVGYWAQGRAEWVWVPAYYVWTPRGVIFVEGFWDYPLERRGLLFAPVYYPGRGYARRGYTYSPRIAINLSIFNDHLFLRPSYHHYYFGDYYGSRYDQGGFYASFSFQFSRSGYDPFYSHNRWEHRQDRDWDNRFQASYQYRRDHEAARPPRTWSAQLAINARPLPAGQARITMAVPLRQLATRKDNPVRFQPVAPQDRQQLAQRGREVQQNRDQRRSVEAKAVGPAGRNPGQAAPPVRVTIPKSPIIARPPAQTGRNQAPPKVQQAPRPDPKVQPKSVTPTRPPDADRRNSPAENRQPVPAGKAPPERRPDSPREPSAQPVPAPRPGAAAANAEAEAQRKAQQAQAQARQESEQRANDAAAKSEAAAQAQRASHERDQAAAARAQADAKQKAQQAQQESARRANDAAAKAQAAERAQPAANERANAPAAKTQAESQRNAQQAQAKAQQESAKRAKDAEAKSAAAAKSNSDPKGRPSDDEDDDRKKDRGKPPGR
jgi:hypothetical protein